MEILAYLLWIVLGLVMLYFGAEWLVKGSAAIAIKLGVSPLVVGLTVVAFGTSAPELLVCLQANLQGNGDIAVGNIVGSNICNILLVLGASAVVFPLAIHVQILRREMGILLLASVVFAGMFWGGQMMRVEGVVLFLGILAYVGYSIFDAKTNPDSVITSELDDVLSDEDVAAARRSDVKQLARDIGLILIGIVMLSVGADRLVYGGERLALLMQVPKAIIALSLFALGTSLPELATGILASWRKEGDIVVGNAIGSCIFNLLAVGGFTALVSPISINELAVIDFAVMILTVVLSMLVMGSRREISRVEGGVMLAIYVSYCVYMFTRGGTG